MTLWSNCHQFRYQTDDGEGEGKQKNHSTSLCVSPVGKGNCPNHREGLFYSTRAALILPILVSLVALPILAFVAVRHPASKLKVTYALFAMSQLLVSITLIFGCLLSFKLFTDRACLFFYHGENADKRLASPFFWFPFSGNAQVGPISSTLAIAAVLSFGSFVCLALLRLMTQSLSDPYQNRLHRELSAKKAEIDAHLAASNNSSSQSKQQQAQEMRQAFNEVLSMFANSTSSSAGSSSMSETSVFAHRVLERLQTKIVSSFPWWYRVHRLLHQNSFTLIHSLFTSFTFITLLAASTSSWIFTSDLEHGLIGEFNGNQVYQATVRATGLWTACEISVSVDRQRNNLPFSAFASSPSGAIVPQQHQHHQQQQQPSFKRPKIMTRAQCSGEALVTASSSAVRDRSTSTTTTKQPRAPWRAPLAQGLIVVALFFAFISLFGRTFLLIWTQCCWTPSWLMRAAKRCALASSIFFPCGLYFIPSTLHLVCTTAVLFLSFSLFDDPIRDEVEVYYAHQGKVPGLVPSLLMVAVFCSFVATVAGLLAAPPTRFVLGKAPSQHHEALATNEEEEGAATTTSGRPSNAFGSDDEEEELTTVPRRDEVTTHDRLKGSSPITTLRSATVAPAPLPADPGYSDPPMTAAQQPGLGQFLHQYQASSSSPASASGAGGGAAGIMLMAMAASKRDENSSSSSHYNHNKNKQEEDDAAYDSFDD